ncbi:Conserved_hypothetical protein [Hexamita inflata]|uniref:Uncharacterized protein n=1 Tax=Hexamita inflata TaxID=28002 RepID=A0AA86QCW1_9EUKA|nr:Conserved hypothetical protein [Hexamita inflata]
MMLSKLDLSKIQSDSQLQQLPSKDSGRVYEIATTLKLADINGSLRLKVCITIAYMLATTDSFVVESLNNEYKISTKQLSGYLLNKISQYIRIQPTHLLQTIEDIKQDLLMMNEICVCAFGVVNFIHRKYNTNQIWDIPDVIQLFETNNLHDIEKECIILQKASPRGRIVGKQF